jgi:hypothetical protein
MDTKGMIWGCLALVPIVFVASAILTGYRRGLRQIPGPFFARFSGLYRLYLVYDGRAPAKYRRAHQEYGPMVRVGPNHVSISDPKAIPQIYGIGTDYQKVSYIRAQSEMATRKP